MTTECSLTHSPLAADADMLHSMTPAHAVSLIGGSLLILTASTALMLRANQSERRVIERRTAEWIAGRCVPEEKPNFYTGNGGSGN